MPLPSGGVRDCGAGRFQQVADLLQEVRLPDVHEVHEGARLADPRCGARGFTYYDLGDVRKCTIISVNRVE
jgi:hypothetical protein